MFSKNKHKDTFHFEITATGKDGTTVPLSFDIEYPKNHGMYVIWTLNQALGAIKSGMLQEFISRGDLSVLEASADLDKS